MPGKIIQPPVLRPGIEIPYSPLPILGSRIGRMVVAVCNLFLKLKVISPDQSVSGRLVFGSTGEAHLELKAESGGSGNSSYRGEYASSGVTEFGSGPFAFGDIVRVTESNPELGSAELGTWVCIIDSATDFPTSAETQWHLISGSGSGVECPYDS